MALRTLASYVSLSSSASNWGALCFIGQQSQALGMAFCPWAGNCVLSSVQKLSFYSHFGYPVGMLQPLSLGETLSALAMC